MTQGVPEGSVIITPAEVYAEVITLTKVVTKMVASDEAESGTRNEDRARLTRVENEVASIKQRLWFVAGVCAAAGGGFGSAVASVLSQH